MRPTILAFTALLIPADTFGGYAAAQIEVPQKVTVCQLLKEPAAYNHHLVEVTGLASHGFEDSGFSDPTCDSRYPGLWMSYGGTRSTGTPSTVNELSRTRPKPPVVERVEIPLVDDATFKHFDSLLHKDLPGDIVHATVIARFFSGELQHLNGDDLWGGYGHLGCCSLFMIQQVLSVDDPDPNLDPNDVPTPDRTTMKVGDSMGDLVWEDRKSPLQLQRAAENGAPSYAFNDPERIVMDLLESKIAPEELTSLNLKQTFSNQYRKIYEGSAGRSQFRIVVNRPAWLAFYASDPSHVAWIVISATRFTPGKSV